MNDKEAAKQLAKGVVVNTPKGRGVLVNDPSMNYTAQRMSCNVMIDGTQRSLPLYCSEVTPVECEDPSEPWLQALVHQFLNEPED